MRDQFHNVKPVKVLAPKVVADDTAQVGAIIDKSGYESLTYVILSGALLDAAATFTSLLEEGDDPALSDAAAVADEDLLGTEALASFDQDDDDTVLKLGYIGNKRYTRLTITPAGNASDAPLAVIALLGHAHDRPVS